MTGMKDQYFGVEVEMTGITLSRPRRRWRIISERSHSTKVGPMIHGSSKTQKTKSGN